ncbi:MAG: DHA2 family efflux MFS transporter permease subunit [Sphingomicrobium sp.]
MTVTGVAPNDRAALFTSNRPLLTIGVMAATLMQILDSTIANVALPHMEATLGATNDTITWVLTSYIVASAVAIPITGWLADRIGSRNLFLLATVGFVVASMLCGLATSLPEMVLFRTLQGIAAAFMNPLSQTAMMDINPPSKQASAMSIWGMGIMVGPVLGPVLGGWLTDNYNWRWVFYVNVPIGAMCIAILWRFLPSRPQFRRNFDLFGFSLLAAALASFQIMLDRGQQKDWFQSWEIILEAMVCLSTTWMFAIHQISGKAPLFNRQTLKNRSLVTGMMFMFVIGVVMMATMALLPQMLQSLFGYPVLDTGFLLVPRGIGVVISMFVAGRAINRGFDPRILVGGGLLIVAISLWQMTGWTLIMESISFIISGFVQGIGIGLVFIPLNITAFGSLSPQHRTEGTSLMNLFRNIGASAGISAATTFLARNVQTSHADLTSQLTSSTFSGLDPEIVSGLGDPSQLVLAIVDGEIRRQAAMIAYLDDFKLMMILTLVVIPLVVLLKRPARPQVGEAVHVAMD